MRKSVIALLALFILAAGAYAQESNSVCRDGIAVPKDLVLSICTNERGMAPIPQPQLYLRVYADGAGEYEVGTPMPKNRSSAYPGLTKKQFQLRPGELQAILALGRADDFQRADGEYPRIRVWDDSSLITTITLIQSAGSKTIIVNNYTPDETDNSEHYPVSFVKLMQLAQDLRDRLTGIKRQ